MIWPRREMRNWWMRGLLPANAFLPSSLFSLPSSRSMSSEAGYSDPKEIMSTSVTPCPFVRARAAPRPDLTRYCASSGRPRGPTGSRNCRPSYST